MILLDRTAANADGANYLLIKNNWQAAAKNNNSLLVGKLQTVQRLSGWTAGVISWVPCFRLQALEALFREISQLETKASSIRWISSVLPPWSTTENTTATLISVAFFHRRRHLLGGGRGDCLNLLALFIILSRTVITLARIVSRGR